MSGLQDLCEKYFGHRELYDVLRIPKTATEKEVRKAYHRLSLLVHPDRVEEHKKKEATEKFKVLGKVHSILSDKEKRAVYDETGVYDEDDEAAERDWGEYWRILFKRITVEDILNYERQYKGSQEEKDDLKRAYLNGKGDMDFILESVPFTNTNEEGRLREILQEMIDEGLVPEYSEFVNETPRKRERRKRKWAKEAEEAEQLREEMGLKDEDNLKALITKRREQHAENFDSFLDNLAEKYAPKKKSTGATKKKAGKKSK